MHDSYGNMTPMHDGARTPTHNSSSHVWDPMAPNTPAHTSAASSSYGGAAGRAEDSFEQHWAAYGGGAGDSTFSSGGGAGTS